MPHYLVLPQEPAEVDDSAQLPVQDRLEQKVADDEKGIQSINMWLPHFT
jgi:hypothetical protein